MKALQIQTQKKDQVIDITSLVEETLALSSVENGICTVFVSHTTCCITAADLDPGTDLDLLDSLRMLLPDMVFRHPHDPSHAPDHILSSIIGPCMTVPFQGKKLLLGIWQRIVLIELDGPRQRNLQIAVIEEK